MLPGGSGTSDDSGGKGFSHAIGALGFEPGELFLIRRPGGDILSSLDFISFSLQTDKQIFLAEGCRDQPVDGSFQLYLVAGAVLCGLMLKVALALVPARDDDGRAIFSAQPITGLAYLMVVALVGMVVLWSVELRLLLICPLLIWVASTNSYLPPNISFTSKS